MNSEHESPLRLGSLCTGYGGLLKMLGNGVVWICAATAYASLIALAAGQRKAVAA